MIPSSLLFHTFNWHRVISFSKSRLAANFKVLKDRKAGNIFFYLYIFIKLSVLYQMNGMHLIRTLWGIEFCVILYCLQSSKKKNPTLDLKNKQIKNNQINGEARNFRKIYRISYNSSWLLIPHHHKKAQGELRTEMKKINS